jgi:hypothetical protein
MSYAAIKEVTHALRSLLRRQIIFEFNSPVVTILPPGDALPKTAGVNLYLYRVLESPFTKNQDWRGDRVTPPATRPALGLQLFYLITPLSATPEDNNADAGDDAHLILGLVMLALEENPILNEAHLPAITVNGRAVPAFDADTALSDFIRNSYEQVKVTLLPTSVDELSKIWATINQPYRLSVAYEVSLVELTPTPPPPAGGGIVLSTGVNVITLDPPRLSLLVPTTGALAQVVGGVLQTNDLQIRGFGLSFPGQTPIVRVAGKVVEIKPVPAPTDQALSVTLPTDVDAGPQVDLRVTLNGRTSTPLTFTVNPWLASTKPIRTALDSTRGAADLKLVLSGAGFSATPQSARFDGPGGVTNVTTFDPGGTDTQATIDIPTALVNGVYDVRIVRTDGSASNPRTLEILPRIDSPILVAPVVVGPNTVHRLTANGARLNGSDVRLALDGVTYVAGVNATANQLVYTLGRLLKAGPHRLALSVDGQMSRPIDFEV